ncbi:type III secretion system stator protein SctL [Mycetohabitans endofungorum]|uniref:type III secretion system stator protein SctL n=1 Tax=Mycetohabitans endofungorum TaxID=417203 RepID=UPI002B056943|nr:type III secretion system stator protein SctL [Mycetohabitans endofungorum]
MAIWLRSPYYLSDGAGARVGAPRDVISAKEFGALLSIEEAYAQLEKDRQQTIEQAKAEAAELIHAANESAQRILEEARIKYETAAQTGYQDGEQRALSQWMERLAELSDSERRMQVRMRERLAQIVTVGVERIVQVQHGNALFERALEVVDRIVEGAAYVRILVSEADHDKACIAFERLAARWREMGRPFPLTVVADRKLPVGSCICESDFGSIDASLATQLRAMRTAITRALKRSLDDIEHNDHPPHGLVGKETFASETSGDCGHGEMGRQGFGLEDDEDTGWYGQTDEMGVEDFQPGDVQVDDTEAGDAEFDEAERYDAEFDDAGTDDIGLDGSEVDDSGIDDSGVDDLEIDDVDSNDEASGSVVAGGVKGDGGDTDDRVIQDRGDGTDAGEEEIAFDGEGRVPLNGAYAGDPGLDNRDELYEEKTSDGGDGHPPTLGEEVKRSS